MTTVGAGRSTSNQRLARTALGTVAGVVIAVATVVVGAQALGVTPPSSDLSPYCPQSYQCVWPAANPIVPQGPNQLTSDKPAMWNSGTSVGPVSIPYAGHGA
jgi:hypothetical protein